MLALSPCIFFLLPPFLSCKEKRKGHYNTSLMESKLYIHPIPLACLSTSLTDKSTNSSQIKKTTLLSYSYESIAPLCSYPQSTPPTATTPPPLSHLRQRVLFLSGLRIAIPHPHPALVRSVLKARDNDKRVVWLGSRIVSSEFVCAVYFFKGSLF